jgi:enamine deaminase RidA (YjgF/YER057c/UK114 family)
VQAMENLKIALVSVGGDFEHVAKINSYLTDIEANANEFREVRAQYFTNKSALPAATLVQVARLANPNFLLEVEVIAVLPPKA